MEQVMKEVQQYNARITTVRPFTEQVLSITFTTGAAIRPGQQLLLSTGNGQSCRSYAIPAGPGGEYMIVICRSPDMEEDHLSFCENDLITFSIRKAHIPFDEQATHHFFFGNEHAAGLFKSYKDLAEARDHEYFGITEIADHNAACLHDLQLMLEHVPATPHDPAANAIQWMEEMHPLCWNTWKDATFYLSADESAACAFKQYLLQKGVPTDRIRS